VLAKYLIFHAEWFAIDDLPLYHLAVRFWSET